MKDLQYSVEVVYPKDEFQLIDSYTEAVFNILKNNLRYNDIEQILLKLNNLEKN